MRRRRYQHKHSLAWVLSIEAVAWLLDARERRRHDRAHRRGLSAQDEQFVKDNPQFGYSQYQRTD